MDTNTKIFNQGDLVITKAGVIGRVADARASDIFHRVLFPTFSVGFMVRQAEVVSDWQQIQCLDRDFNEGQCITLLISTRELRAYEPRSSEEEAEELKQWENTNLYNFGT